MRRRGRGGLAAAARGLGAGLLGLSCLLACSSPQIVDCGEGGGRFVRLEDDSVWCVYVLAPSRCPSPLPFEQELSFGATACVPERRVEEPEELCVAAGFCEAPDGGS